MESRSGAMEKALFRKTMNESIYVMLVGLHCQRLFSLQRSVLALQKTKHERWQFVIRVKLELHFAEVTKLVFGQYPYFQTGNSINSLFRLFFQDC